MPSDTDKGRHETSSNENEERTLNRRNILLGSSALVAAAAITSGALAQAQKARRQPLRRLLLQRLLQRPAASQISWSSGVTMSASRTSVPTRMA